MAKKARRKGARADTKTKGEAQTIEEKPPRNLKLNIGGGEHEVPGYINVDRRHGMEAYPLPFPDGSASLIRASHILEHFPAAQSKAVLDDWVRVLRPGGKMKISVPDLDAIIRDYESGKTRNPTEGYIMGGQTDCNDFHQSIWNQRKLRAALQESGLLEVVPWESKIVDCATMPISVNLMGTKPTKKRLREIQAALPRNIRAAMSVPRLGFMENFFTAFEALMPLKIKLTKSSGAYWGMCITRAMEICIDEGADAILTLDYDSVFTTETVQEMVRLYATHPEVDAIAALQMGRTQGTPLMTIKHPTEDHNMREISAQVFEPDLVPCATAHFGLTLIRVSSLLRMPKPWFMSVPDKNGAWKEGRIDADIWFWRQMAKAGMTLCLAPRCPIGHIQETIVWADKQFKPIDQLVYDYHVEGMPANAWT